jgi:3-hydroxyisobutyrate dehydrogenase-like beta-hydroxyacid dehydrogenase
MPSSTRPVVAVVGIGRMGSAIAGRLLREGFTVRVFNRTPGRTDTLVGLGADPADTVATAADGADVIVSCMLDDTALTDISVAPDGLVGAMAPGAVHVSTATVSPGCSNAIAIAHERHGQAFLAAPVIGRPEVAAAGQLLSLAGGRPEVLECVQPVLGAYSSRVLETGVEPGSANSLKLAVNFYIASMAELFGEVLAFTEKSGVTHETAMDALRSLQGHPGISGYLERIGAREFDDAGFAMGTGLKDLGLISDAAAAVRCPLPFAAIARDKTITAIASGLGAKDWSAFTEIARRNAGLDARLPTASPDGP